MPHSSRIIDCHVWLQYQRVMNGAKSCFWWILVDSQLGCAIPDGANFSPPGCLSPSNHWAVPQTWLKQDAWLSISKQPGMMIPNWRFFQWDHEPVFFPTRTIRWWHDCCRDPFYEDFSTKVWILKAKSRKNICWAEVRCTRSAFRQQRAVKRNCRCHVAPGRNHRKTGIHRIHSKIRISPTRTDRFHQQIRIWIGASAMILSATRFWLLIPPWKWSKWSLHVCVFYPLQNHGFWVHRLMWFPWKMKWVCHGPMNQLINLQYVLDFVPSMGTPAVPANSVGRSFSSSHGRVLQGGPWELLLIKCQASQISQTWYTFQQTWLAGKSPN